MTRYFSPILISTWLLFLMPGATSGKLSAPVRYSVDPVHSSILFRCKHNNASYFYGRMNSFSGTIVLDEQNISNSSVTVEVDANSVDTKQEKRDDHLRSPDFFNARQFPKISFRSKSVRRLADGTLEVRGDFTLRGVTRELTLKVHITGKGRTPQGKEVIGFHTVFTIQRSDFNVRYGLGQGLDNDVQITVSLEAVRQ
jgi:polyisoprenoid-binding protein YceI